MYAKIGFHSELTFTLLSPAPVIIFGAAESAVPNTARLEMESSCAGMQKAAAIT